MPCGAHGVKEARIAWQDLPWPCSTGVWPVGIGRGSRLFLVGPQDCSTQESMILHTGDQTPPSPHTLALSSYLLMDMSVFWGLMSVRVFGGLSEPSVCLGAV